MPCLETHCPHCRSNAFSRFLRWGHGSHWSEWHQYPLIFRVSNLLYYCSRDLRKSLLLSRNLYFPYIHCKCFIHSLPCLFLSINTNVTSAFALLLTLLAHHQSFSLHWLQAWIMSTWNRDWKNNRPKELEFLRNRRSMVKGWVNTLMPREDLHTVRESVPTVSELISLLLLSHLEEKMKGEKEMCLSA